MDNNVTEKTKMNKKTIIIAAVVIIAIILIAVIVALVKGGSYKNTIKKLEKSMDSEESMEKFVDKNVNLRAFYVFNTINDDGEFDTDELDGDAFAKKFEEVYNKAKKSDYTDDEIKDIAYDFYKNFVDGEIKITDIGKLKSVQVLNVYGAEFKIKGLKSCKIAMESDGSKMDAYAYFYKGKLFVIIPDLGSIEY